MKTKDRAPSRPGKGGRKKLPKEERKVLVPVYVPLKIVEKHGGMKKAKELCISLLQAV